MSSHFRTQYIRLVLVQYYMARGDAETTCRTSLFLLVSRVSFGIVSPCKLSRAVLPGQLPRCCPMLRECLGVCLGRCTRHADKKEDGYLDGFLFDRPADRRHTERTQRIGSARQWRHGTLLGQVSTGVTAKVSGRRASTAPRAIAHARARKHARTKEKRTFKRTFTFGKTEVGALAILPW